MTMPDTNTPIDDEQYPTLNDYNEGDRIHPENVAHPTDRPDYTPDDAPDNQIGLVHQRKNNNDVRAVLYDARTDLYAVVSASTDRHVQGHDRTSYYVKSIGSEIRAEVSALRGKFDEPEGDEGRAKEWLETQAPVETVHGNDNWYYADSAYDVSEYAVYDNGDGFYPERFRFDFVAVDA